MAYGELLKLRKDEAKIGYTFGGWHVICDGEAFIGNTMPARELVVEGNFTVNSYQLTYYVNNQKVEGGRSYTYGEIITHLDYQEKEGYTFSGWDCKHKTMPAYDLNVYGRETINVYSVTYQIESDKNVIPYSINVVYGEQVPFYNFTAPAGYYFDGWTYNGENFTAETVVKMPASDIVIKGRVRFKVYTLRYYVNNEVVHQETYEYQAQIVPYEYHVDGYQCTWTALPSIMPANDVAVFGNLTENLYEIEYYVDNELVHTDVYPVGMEISFRAEESKIGYTFSGWTNIYDEEGKEYIFIDGKMPAKNIKIYSTFKVNSYTIKYFVNGEKFKEERVVYDAEIQGLAYTPKTGYSFSGWIGLPETMPACDVNVHGKEYISTYKLSYYVDGELFEDYDVPYGTKISPLHYTPVLGYAFSGWDDLPQVMPAKDVNVYATTTPCVYTLTYYVDGTEVYSEEYAVDAAIDVYVYEPEKGKEFLGWVNVITTMLPQDYKVFGSTHNKNYHLNYYIDSKLVFSDVYAYDASITVREVEQREGYTFTGWGDVARRMPASDVMVFGSFVPNKHQVEYYVGEQLLYTDTYNFGETIHARADEQKEGYVFSGWSNIPTTMPDKDVKVTGTFTQKVGVVEYYVNGILYKTQQYAYKQKIDLNGFAGQDYKVVGWMLNGVDVVEYEMKQENVRLEAKLEKDKQTFVETKSFVALVSVGGTAGAFGLLAIIRFLLKLKR